MTEDQVRQTLSTVKYPGFTRDIVSFGLVKNIHVEGSDVTVQMALTTADARVPQEIKVEAEKALGAVPGIGKVAVRINGSQVTSPSAIHDGDVIEVPGAKLLFQIPQ